MSAHPLSMATIGHPSAIGPPIIYYDLLLVGPPILCDYNKVLNPPIYYSYNDNLGPSFYYDYNFNLGPCPLAHLVHCFVTVRPSICYGLGNMMGWRMSMTRAMIR